MFCALWQEPAIAAVIKMLAGRDAHATAAAVCLLREAFDRTTAQPGPVSAANWLKIANNRFGSALADALLPDATETSNLLASCLRADTVSEAVAGQPS